MSGVEKVVLSVHVDLKQQILSQCKLHSLETRPDFYEGPHESVINSTLLRSYSLIVFRRVFLFVKR